jgi:hypothetical protein
VRSRQRPLTNLTLHPGGKHFSRDLKPLDADGNEISMWSADAKKDDDSEEDSDESSEEESEEESDDDAPTSSAAAAAAELSREERKKEKQARKAAAVARAKAQSVQVGDLPPSDDDEESEEEDNMLANPNHSKASRNQAKVVRAPAKAVEEVTEKVKKVAISGTPSRKERESQEAAEAKERYLKMHLAGKTDEAKADMARLRLIREKREAEAARKQVRDDRRLLISSYKC